jgi:heme exporter protein A
MLDVSKLVLERYFQAVFQPLDIVLAAAELLIVTGDNGSGKTTLLRLLAGIIQPTSGTIRRSAGRIAYLGHALGVKEDLNSLENLQFVRDFDGDTTVTEAVTVEQALQITGLSRVALQPARTLSAGQRKRCALARLLLQPAELWLLDEPYSNLDQPGIDLMDTLLAQHIRTGGSAVVATHGEHRPQIPHQELAVIAGFVH